jgi:hypothetical protein
VRIESWLRSRCAGRASGVSMPWRFELQSMLVVVSMCSEV